MIRSHNHSSFPRVGDTPLDHVLRIVLNKQERGQADADEVAAAVDEVTTISVAQQGRAFINIVTDGMVRWAGPLSHIAGAMSGLQTAELYRWFETNFYERRVEVVGAIGRDAPFTLGDFRVAESVAQSVPVKPVLPGPVTFARLARDRHYGDREALARAVAGVLAQEVADLAAAGATCFQIDEPMLCRHPEDLALVAETASTVFGAAGAEATTILSTYFGDLASIADRLDRLPGTHLGLELTPGHGNLDLLKRLPDGRGVALGVFDARETRQEDPGEVIAMLEPHKDELLSRDVLIGPNAGLELLPRDQAFDKLLHSRYVVEQLSKDWAWAS